MSLNRPRAKSYSVSSSSSSEIGFNQQVKSSAPVQEADEPNSASVPHIIKVSHRKPQIKVKVSRIGADPEDSNDSVDSGNLADNESVAEEESLSAPTKEKFKLFSPRKKHSPRNLSTTNPSPRAASQNSSPRSTNSSPRNASPRNSSPRLLNKTPRSNNNSPRLTDSSDSLPLGELPIDKKDAVQLMEIAKHKIADPSSEQIKHLGISFKHAYRKDFTREYEVIVTGTDQHGSGSSFYLLDRANKFGSGGYSEVCAAYNLMTGEKCAAKIYNKNATFTMIADEKNCLEGLKRFRGAFNLDRMSENEKVIFMDFFPGMSLLKVLYQYTLPNKEEGGTEVQYLNKIHFPIQIKLDMIIKILTCVADLHEAGFIHRDIKSDNFLCRINSDGSVDLNLIDVDTAIPKDKSTIKIASTFAYLAPELHKDIPEPYSIQSDMFSTGVVIWEVITGENFQKNLTNKFNDILQNEKWKRHLSRAELISLLTGRASDNALSLHEKSHSLNEKEALERPMDQAIEYFIYHGFIKRKIMILLSQLTEEDPSLRLKGSSLRNEIDMLVQLRLKLNKAIQSAQSLIKGIAGIQEMGLPLKPLNGRKDLREMVNALMDVYKDSPQQASKNNPESFLEDYQHQFFMLFEALKSYTAGLKGLSECEISPLSLKPLLRKFTPNSAETIDFFYSPSGTRLTPQNEQAIFEVSTKK